MRHPLSRQTVRAALILVLAAAGLSASGGSHAEAALRAPWAAGDDAANIPHDRSGVWVMQRWTARHTGVIRRLYFHTKIEGSDDCEYRGRSGYASGSSGRLLATTHRTLPGGRPDMRTTLARSEFTPCGNDDGETVWVDLGFRVKRGQEFATVVRNADARPNENYFSSNFLWAEHGVVGANGRNTRRAGATDAYYGLDPRELVGYSRDAGRSWRLPGGPYGGRNGSAFIPSYIQEYADGRTAGQPYYWSTSLDGTVRMIFPRVRSRWTIRALGAYTTGPGSSWVTLTVNGVRRRTAWLSGSGFRRALVKPLVVPRGRTVAITTTAGSGGLALRRMEVDAFWAEKLRLGTGSRFYLDGAPRYAATLYALPAYWAR